jgi:hypothetical protein
MRSSLFWDFRQRRLVLYCERFRATYRSNLQYSIKMEPKRCSGTSVEKKNYRSTLRKIPEQRRSREKTCFLRSRKCSCTCYLDSFRRHAVAQLVETLRYKPQGHGFYFRWCHWNFSLTNSFLPHYDPGVDSASNRNEY